MLKNETITLSLISHTNIGKTTLARTLLRKDVGEVGDQPHVTDESRFYTMIEEGQVELRLWDTPGFGPSTPLMKRFRREGGVWGWLMNEIVDRVLNRPLYCSFEAAKNVRDHADVVLYLVNVNEAPQDAGYVEAELSLLETMQKPVIMILNQIRTKVDRPSQWRELEQLWLEHFRHFNCLKSVMVLDGFSRHWWQELHLMEAVKPVLSPERRPLLDRLMQKFTQRQREMNRQSALHAAELIAFACRQEVELEANYKRREVFASMSSELQLRLDHFVDQLLDIYGIEASGRAELEARVEDVAGLVARNLSEKQTGILAGAISGASSGLLADLMSGGLSFGGGFVLGALLGGLGGMSLAKLVNTRGNQTATWTPEILAEILLLALAHDLCVAHHGRGKGFLKLKEAKEAFGREILAVADLKREQIQSALVALRHSEPDPSTATKTMADLFSGLTQDILRALYPGLPEPAP